jgi:hypothetical protein
MPVAEQCQTLAVLLPYRALERGLPRYGSGAGWIKYALDSFRQMPPRRDGQAIPADRLIAVLQGWGVSMDEQRAQIRQSEKAGAAGYLLALTKIDQSWRPKIVKASRSPVER